MQPDLSVEIAGLALANPLLPGSGPPGDGLEKLTSLDSARIGALVTKTISVALPEVARPTMATDGELFFNVEKWSERPYAEWLSDILPALENRFAPLLVSLGYTPDDLETLIPLFDPLVDGFELSTHYIAADSKLFADTIKRARSLTRKPIFPKLSWHGGHIATRAALCADSGADGITAINSVPALSIDSDKRASRLGGREPYCWLSGPAIKPLALRAVYDAARAVDIPVIACGGATSGTDAIEFMLAGASAVETCTALLRKGPALVGEMLDEMRAWCAAQGVAAIRDIVGTVIPHYTKRDDSP